MKDSSIVEVERQARKRNEPGARPVRRACRLGLKRVLVPVDFSPCSEKALRYAAALARKFKAEMVLLHVVELYPIDYVLGREPDNDESSWLAERVEQRLEWLRQLCAPSKGWRSERIVRQGKPYQEIIKAARECGA